MEIISRRALPPEWAELPRSFRPWSIHECDMPRLLEGDDGRIHQRQRRTRVLACLTPDQQLTVVPYDMGPATGDEAISMPCAGAVEIAEVWELFEWYGIGLAKRKARAVEAEPERTAAFLEALAQEQDELEKRVVGASTVGPYHRVEREAPSHG